MAITTAEDILNPLSSKVVFAKVFYIESGDLKYLLFSDKYKKFSNGDKPDVRISSIPFFKKEIDPINNNIIIQSAYKLNLFNQDDVLTSLFNGRIFNNQAVEFYISTEDSTDEILIAKGLYDEANVGEVIEISLKEISDLTKVNRLEKFSTYSEDPEERLTEYNEEYVDETERDTQEPTFKDKVKKIVLGKYPLVKCENINPVESSEKWTTSRVWGYIEKVSGTNYYRLYVTNFPNGSGYAPFGQETLDTPHIQKLRKSAFDGDFLTIAGWESKFTFSVASSLYTTSTANPFSVSPVQNKYINLQFEEGDESYFTNALSPKRLLGEVLLKSSDGNHYNDEYHVSDKTDSTFETSLVTELPPFTTEVILHSDKEAGTPGTDQSLNYTHKIHEKNTGTNWIKIADNWNFLEAGDRIDLEVYVDDTIQQTEQVEVESFDIATKKIYFKEPDSLSAYALELVQGLNITPNPDFRVQVKFEKIQKIKIKNKTLFLKKNYFDLKIGLDGNGNYRIEDYPFQINDYNYRVKYNGGFDWAFPGVRCWVKRNAFHSLINLAQVGRGQLSIPDSNQFEGNTIMHYGVSDYVDWTSGANCKVEYQFSGQGDFYKPDGNNSYNYNFFRFKIRSGICTVGELMALADDINCPFYFTHDGTVTTSTVINFSALTASATILSSTTNSVEVSASDYPNFMVGDIINVPYPGSGSAYLIVTSRAVVTISMVDHYFIYYATQAFVAPTGGTIYNTLKAIDSTRYFRIPGYFSVDINQPETQYGTSDNNDFILRSQKYRTSARRQSEEADTTASTLLNLEKNSDLLVRKANEKSKLFFGWWLEHNGDAADSAYNTWTQNTYKTKSIPQWLTDGSESFNSLSKPGYSSSSTILSRIVPKYGNFINLCPKFNLNLASNYAWGGDNVTGFGYNVGGQSKKDQAIAQAVANRINEQANLSNLYMDSGLKIIAVAVKDGDTWYVRVKHMTYNNCSTNVFKELWDKMDNNVEVVSKPTNYCAFIPFIRNNSLYVKLDRKALSLANSVGTDENFYLINLSGAENAMDTIHYLNDHDHFKVKFRDTVLNGNGSGSITSWYSLPISQQVDYNPNQLIRRYTGFSFANMLNFTAPNVFSKKIGSPDYEKLVNPDKGWIIESRSYLVPDLFHVIAEKFNNAYRFNNNTDESKTFADNEAYYLSVENYYQMTNWDSETVQPNYAKKNFWLDSLGVKVGYWGCRIVEPFELSKSDYVYANFKDKNANLGSILETLLSVYNITNFDPANIAAVKELGITGYLILDKEQEFYKSINPMLEANNMICFVNKDNKITFEKLNLLSTSADKTLSYYDTLSMNKLIDFPKFSKIIINYLKDETTEKVQTQEILNTAKNATFITFGIDNPKKIEANIIREITDPDDLEMLVQKYTEQNEYLEIQTDLSLIQLDLNDVVEQELKDGSTSLWLVVRKETNFGTMRFKMIKCI